ncbi:MAG: phenylalanine--tRNA ligase subunit beta [Defluviitaleaceae bacterium]|nr:phenylalanine--tRNA ligase subunit beta [Defluviitaleaceae bacterium]
MKIPMSWLKTIVPVEKETRAFMDDMSRTGTVAETLTVTGTDITNVIVGKINKIEKHPNADKLLIVQADVGGGVMQIVTGADNLKAGDFVPVATDGAVLAGGKKIKRGKLRGEMSEGMLCSIDELGFTRHDFPEAPEDGIYVFLEPQTLGADARPILQMIDEIIEFDITSNRSDCNSIYGIAREAAAAYGKKLILPSIAVKAAAEKKAEDEITVTIKTPQTCPRYIARTVKNIKLGPSPQWMRRRLSSCGIRPINNIVDITNYVMLEYGQPLHAFDIDHVAGKHIEVRMARGGEKFVTLDGTIRVLDETMTVIADRDKALAIAGIMGGENSMVTEDARAILFESANFDATNIRLTSKKLGLRTEASGRYEKGLDPELSVTAVNRAMELVELLGCGEVTPFTADAYPTPRIAKRAAYRPSRVNALLGTNISAGDMENYLENIGIETRKKNSDEYEAVIPTFRPDIECEADIIEEVARFFGYDNIPATLSMKGAEQGGGKNRKQAALEHVHNVMRSLGYNEALTCAFESPKAFDRLLMPPDSPLRNAIKIINPIGDDFSLMRTTTLDAMLNSIAVNCSRRNEYARLFETAPVFLADALPLTDLPCEKLTLTFAAYDKKQMDFFDMKGDVEQLLEMLEIDGHRFESCSALPHMHPGRTAADPALGYFGELHPRAAANYQINARVYVAALDLENILARIISKKGCAEYKPLSKFPPAERDIALQVKREVTAMQVDDAIRQKGGQWLADVILFDVYEGRQIQEGFKSMAYSLSFRSAERTLTDDEINKKMSEILAHLAKTTGAVLRDK